MVTNCLDRGDYIGVLSKMRQYQCLPTGDVETWVFDLDNTLYPARYDLFAQIDQRMGRFIARKFGISTSEAKIIQKKYFHAHGTTLRGLMLNHGIEPNAFLSYVHDVDVSVLPTDPRLHRALEGIGGRKFVFTNASAAHAWRVLERVGIANHFADVFDIFTAEFVPKPTPCVYDRLIRHCDFDPAKAAMIDDIARNLRPAADRGMLTVWVSNGDPTAPVENDVDYVDHVTGDVAGWLSDVRVGTHQS